VRTSLNLQTLTTTGDADVRTPVSAVQSLISGLECE
jgi:hypothetical protein